MKIAIEISGHMRTFYTMTSVKNLREFMKRNNDDTFDIFISTYDEPGYWCDSDDKKGVDNLESYFPSLEKDIVDIYNPKSYEIENLDDLIDGFHSLGEKILNKNKTILRPGWPSRKQNTIGQLYKINRVSKLRREYEDKNNFKYDLVIRYRPDNIIYNFEYEKPENGYIQSKLRKRLDRPTNIIEIVFEDVMYAGTSDDMYKFSNIYNDLEALCDSTDTYLCAHDLRLHALDYYNLKIKEILWNVSPVNTPFGYCRKK